MGCPTKFDRRYSQYDARSKRARIVQIVIFFIILAVAYAAGGWSAVKGVGIVILASIGLIMASLATVGWIETGKFTFKF